MQVTVKKHYGSLVRDILAHKDELETYVQADALDGSSVLDLIPQVFRRDLPTFQQLLLIKLLKPVQMMPALREFVARELGPIYAVSPLTSMESLFSSADKVTPIIFVLSQGADPNEQILGYARK